MQQVLTVVRPAGGEQPRPQCEKEIVGGSIWPHFHPEGWAPWTMHALGCEMPAHAPIGQDSRCSCHAEVPAAGSCMRCGDYLCQYCIASRPIFGVYCQACEAPAATRGSRLLGHTIDRLLWFVGAAVGTVALSKVSSQLSTIGFVVGALTMLGLELALLATRRQSLGKMLMGTGIVKLDGSAAEPWRAALLHTLLAKTVLSAPLLNLVDQVWIFGSQSRCLHDVVSGTRVVQVARAPA
jgi:uncharacterized RDD family membrane protein YckC